MKIRLPIIGLFLVSAWAAQGQTFTGILIDLDCRDRNPDSRCAAGTQTTHFGLQTPDGQFYKLEAPAAGLQNVTQGQNGDVGATVYGRLLPGNIIDVESVAGSGLTPGAPEMIARPTPTPEHITVVQAEQPQTKPSGSSIQLPDGRSYRIEFAEGVHVHDERKAQTKEHVARMTISGPLRGDTIFVDSVTVR